MEGKIDGKYGHIVCVLDVLDIGKGTIIPSKGHAEFDVVYNALILKVFKNMVVDGIVTTVNKVSGPVELAEPLLIFSFCDALLNSSSLHG